MSIPLYWKWTWSMSSKPAFRKVSDVAASTDEGAAWAQRGNHPACRRRERMFSVVGQAAEADPGQALALAPHSAQPGPLGGGELPRCHVRVYAVVAMSVAVQA